MPDNMSVRCSFPKGYDFSQFLPALVEHSPIGDRTSGELNFAIGDIKYVPGLKALFENAAMSSSNRLPGLANILPGMRGYSPLVNEIAAIIQEETNSLVEPSNIVLTNGGCSGLWAAVTAVCDPGDIVAYAVPSFPYWCVLHSTGVRQEQILFQRPTEYANGYADRLEELCRTSPPKAIILNEPQNPMGYPLDISQLSKLSELCDMYGFWIIMDEVARPYNFDSTEWWGIHLPKDKVIQVDSFTKRYAAPGLRLGWLACPPKLVSHVQGLFANVQGGVSNIAAEFGFRLMSETRKLADGNPCTAELRRRHLALKQIKYNLDENIEFYYNQGLYALYYFTGEKKQFEQRLNSANIRVMDGSFQYPDPSIAPLSYRFSIGGVQEDSCSLLYDIFNQ